MFNYWLRFFEHVWADEVDRLFILANTPAEKAVTDYLKDRVLRSPLADMIDLEIVDHQIEHGDAINRLLEKAGENIMLIEDDAYIFRQGMVDMCFTMLEGDQYDIIGSKRVSCSIEILNRAKELWGIDYHGLGDQGCNFWPNFFFTHKSLMLATSRNFGARAWQKGEVISSLADYVVEVETLAGDTFVEASLELRNLVPEHRIRYVPQYHTHPDDWEHYVKRESIWDKKAPWCHIGSLSSGFSGEIRDEQFRPLALRTKIEPQELHTNNRPNSPMERKEWERRVQMWLSFHSHREVGHLDELAEQYHNGLERLITNFKLSRENIQNRRMAYSMLGL